MPVRRKGEKLSKYVSRCVPEVMGEGKGQKAAVGKCYGMGKSHWKPKKK